MRNPFDNEHGLRWPRLRNYALHLGHRLGLRRWREALVERDQLSIVVRTGTHDEVIVREVWEEGIYPLTQLELGPGDLVVDVGAQIGSFTLLAAATGARVIAVEPSPLNVERLRANVARNGFEDLVEVREAAVTRPGVRELELHLTYTNLGGHSSIAWIGPTVRVLALSLAQLFDEAGLGPGSTERCRVLKLDVEGGECPILYSADPALLARVDIVFAEVIDHPAAAAGRQDGEPPHDHEGLVGYLEGLGFSASWDPLTHVVAARRRRPAPDC